MPIIPFVIEGEWIYNAGGKHDITFWDAIPAELEEERTQFLFYEGVTFVDKLQTGMDTLMAKNMPRLPASRPPDPRQATDATNNVTVIYDEAYDFAYRGELDHAKKLFRKLVKYNDPIFGTISLEWVHIIDEYSKIKGMAARKSTRKIAKTQWTSYTEKFPKNFLEGVFDPANIDHLLNAKPANRQQAPTVSAPPKQVVSVQTTTKPSSKSLMPDPFEWIKIPGGRGTMKTDEDSVTLTIPTESYWIGKYPVTNAQFAKFIDADGYDTERWWTKEGWQKRQDESWTEPRYWQNDKFNSDMQPVVGVSWFECVAFCMWLGDTTGEKIMLPTEAQWQYAAQGDDDRAYPWGNDWDSSKCQNSVEGGFGNAGNTSSVTQHEGKGDSPFGVVDMAGNVSGWCLTDYKEETNDINSNANRRVLRGGSWNRYSTDHFRCGNRGWSIPHDRYLNRGFRVARFN